MEIDGTVEKAPCATHCCRIDNTKCARNHCDANGNELGGHHHIAVGHRHFNSKSDDDQHRTNHHNTAHDNRDRRLGHDPVGVRHYEFGHDFCYGCVSTVGCLRRCDRMSAFGGVCELDSVKANERHNSLARRYYVCRCCKLPWQMRIENDQLECDRENLHKCLGRFSRSRNAIRER